MYLFLCDSLHLLCNVNNFSLHVSSGVLDSKPSQIFPCHNANNLQK